MRPIQSLLVAAVISFNAGFAQPVDTTKQVICNYPAKVSSIEEFVVMIYLKLSGVKEKIKISTLPEFSNYKTDPDIDIFFIVQKKTDTGFVITPQCADVDNLYMERPLKEITGTGVFKLGEETLGGLFCFPKGEYRFKAVIKLSRYNKGMADIESDWCPVEAINDLKFSD